MPEQEVAYDVVAGVSIGAINSNTIAVHPIGEEKKAIEELKRFWFDHPIRDLVSLWPYLGPLEAVYRTGIFNNDKLRTLIEEVMGEKQYQRGVIWHSTDIRKGEVVVFDEKVDRDMRIDAIISTASVPVVFPNVNTEHYTLVDGFVFENLGLTESIIKCREFGFDD